MTFDLEDIHAWKQAEHACKWRKVVGKQKKKNRLATSTSQEFSAPLSDTTDTWAHSARTATFLQRANKTGTHHRKRLHDCEIQPGGDDKSLIRILVTVSTPKSLKLSEKNTLNCVFLQVRSAGETEESCPEKRTTLPSQTLLEWHFDGGIIAFSRLCSGSRMYLIFSSSSMPLNGNFTKVEKET